MNLMDKFTRVDSRFDEASKKLTMQVNLANAAVMTFDKDTSLQVFKEKLIASGA
jgi:hypothetical protein